MAKNWQKEKKQEEEVSQHGYYLYADGYSYWGIPIYRNGQRPILCEKEVHNQGVEEKIAWYRTEVEQ